MASLLSKGFLQGKTTVSWIVWPVNKGEVHAISAYPTGGVPGVQLRVDRIRYEKYVEGANWLWKLLFDVTNASGNGIVYETYWSKL